MQHFLHITTEKTQQSSLSPRLKPPPNHLQEPLSYFSHLYETPVQPRHTKHLFHLHYHEIAARTSTMIATLMQPGLRLPQRINHPTNSISHLVSSRSLKTPSLGASSTLYHQPLPYVRVTVSFPFHGTRKKPNLATMMHSSMRCTKPLVTPPVPSPNCTLRHHPLSWFQGPNSHHSSSI